MTEIKRYIVHCAICHNKKRRAKPSLYCSDACKQVAYRRRKAERIKAAALAEQVEATRQRKVIEARQERLAELKRQQQAEAERQRLAKEKEQRRQESEERERQERAKRQREIAVYVPVCACGNQEWSVTRWTTWRGVRCEMYCTKCRRKIEPTIDPGPCECGMGNKGDYHYEVNGQGELVCHWKHIGGRRNWQEWPINHR